MPIIAIVTADGITCDHYEALRREVQWEQRQPPGAMLHAAGFDPEGNLRVVDVWASTGEMERFFEDRLAPALAKLGLAMPAVQTFPAHNVNGFPTLDKHLLQRGA